MTILETVKAQALAARKARDAASSSLLTTLQAGMEAVGKSKGNREPTDAEAVAVIKSFLNGVNDTLTARPGDSTALFEKAILDALLPTQLTEDQLRGILSAVLQTVPVEQRGPKAKGVLMASIKASHPGLYDGAVAGRIVSELLA